MTVRPKQGMNIILNYPRAAKKLLPEGVTIIEIKDKEIKQVTLPDGSHEDIYYPFPIKLCKSATIYTDADIRADFLLDTAITFTGLITPPGVRIPNVWFDRVEITNPEVLFYISMSTLPDGAPEDISLERPVLKNSKFNEGITADTDIFDSALSPVYPTSDDKYAAYFRIMVSMSSAGVLTVRRTYGGTTISEQLNSGANLVANGKYSFVIEVQYDEMINLQYSVDATALKLAVLEIAGGM